MDNHRPELDLKFFNDICPDKNGTLSLNICNGVQRINFKSLSLPYSPSMTNSFVTSKLIWKITETQATAYQIQRRDFLKSTTCVTLVMVRGLCDWKVRSQSNVNAVC